MKLGLGVVGKGEGDTCSAAGGSYGVDSLVLWRAIMGPTVLDEL